MLSRWVCPHKGSEELRVGYFCKGTEQILQFSAYTGTEFFIMNHSHFAVFIGLLILLMGFQVQT